MTCMVLHALCQAGLHATHEALTSRPHTQTLNVQLVPLEKSRMKGIVNTRRMMMEELGWDPEWEVNPKELRLIEKIGGWGIWLVWGKCVECQVREAM